MTRDDDELGPVRMCPRCGEEWPDDEEFWLDDRAICRACRYEQQNPYQVPGPKRERRLSMVRENNRRARQSQSA